VLLPVIDAHQHFWDLDRHNYPWLKGPVAQTRYGESEVLCRSYRPDDYFHDTRNQNVVGSVHVEAEIDRDDCVTETRWLHEIADRYGFPNAIVAHARFERDDIASVLDQHAAYPLVRGIRQKPAVAPSASEVVAGAPGSMSDPKWRSGFALLEKFGFSYDVQIPHWHLFEAAELARAFPGTTIILNHTGLPVDRSAEGLRAWRRGMATLAAEPNTAVKISGIGVAGQPWTVERNRPVVLDTIGLFGVDRCMFASNFPVDRVVADYDVIFDGFRAMVSSFTAADQRKLLHDNAVRLYRL
jgi:predicted TIM-barrel fold metal-dependent hydrolase